MNQKANLKPFLKGENVFLRGLLPQDLEGNYLAWFNDQEVTAHNSHGRFPNTTDKLETYYKNITNSKNDLVLAIVENTTELHLGNIALQNIDWVNRSAEYAIIIGEKSTWGKGYGKEASDLILQHGFNELDLHRIHCGTAEDNGGMQSLAKHMGMKEEGRRRQALFKNGKHKDILEYGVLREEYLILKD